MAIKPPRTWPDYLPGPADDIFAVGVIALTYGFLENLYRCLFSTVTGMTTAQVAVLFERLPNNARQDILAEMLNQSDLADPLKEAVRHFSSGFRICAENRSAIMHSHSGGMVIHRERGIAGILFSKLTKSGKKQVCPATIEELRAVADSMHEYGLFAAWLISDVNSFWAFRRRGEEESFWRFPLRDKPPLPAELNWRAEADFLKERSLPRSSEE